MLLQNGWLRKCLLTKRTLNLVTCRAKEAMHQTQATLSCSKYRWSYGVVLWEIATLGETPYSEVAIEDLYDMVAVQGYRMPCPRDCSLNMYSIMLRCWDRLPGERPQFSQIVKELQEEEFV
eukprot:m.238459 g.238459  ORF g.238459 m.238459 type:complete len:121 (+) comp40164_c0_seq16:772-1134(+)